MWFTTADLPLPSHTSASSRRAPSFVVKSSLRRVIDFWLWLLKSCHYCYTSSRYKRALIRMKAAPLPRWLCWYCRNPPVRLAQGFFKNNKGVPSDFFPVVFVKHMNDVARTLEVYIQTWDALQPSLVLLCSFNIFDSVFDFHESVEDSLTGHTWPTLISCFSFAIWTHMWRGQRSQDSDDDSLSSVHLKYNALTAAVAVKLTQKVGGEQTIQKVLFFITVMICSIPTYCI